MHPPRFAFLAIIALASLPPLPAAPASSPLPVTALATPNTGTLAQAWLAQCTERVAAFNDKPCEAIFIGDSITQNFWDQPHGNWKLVGHDVWQKYYGDRAFLNFGVGGDSIQNALWRMDHLAIAKLRPKVAVIMLGMNNAKNTPKDIATGIQAVIDKTRSLFPGVKVVTMSVTPNGRMTEKTPLINERLKALADGRDIFYVDLYSQMPPTGPNKWKGVGGDKIHLTPEGYELWATALAPTLNHLLGR